MMPLVWKMALPSVAAQLVNLLYSIIDRIYIGHIEGIGTDALAGIGITSSIIILISAFAQIVGGGGAPLCAIALGKGDVKKAEKTLGNGVLLLAVFSLLCLGLVYPLMDPLLSLAGASEITGPYAKEYLSVYMIGTPFVLAAGGLNLFISAQGQTRISMQSVLIGAILNTALDPLFIFAFHMGVRGAAVATVLSQAVSAVYVVGFLLSSRSAIRLRLSDLAPERAVILPILALGISPFVMQSTESLVGLVLNGTLSTFGDVYVGALTVMQSAMQMIAIPLTGFTQGVSPLISYNYGHKNNDRVKETFRYTLWIGFLFNFLGFGFMILFPSFVASLFVTDAALIEIVRRYMPIFFSGMTIFGLQRVCQTTFVALGDAKISLLIALLRKVLLLIPLVYLFSYAFGVFGVYLAEGVADALAAMLCILIFSLRFPKLLAKNQVLSIAE
jgi:putative MATE family efflux protein